MLPISSICSEFFFAVSIGCSVIQDIPSPSTLGNRATLKHSKLFQSLPDSKGIFYNEESHILGTSYFSKNAYSRQTYLSNGYIGARLSTLGQGFTFDQINTHTDTLDEETLQNGWPLFNRRYTGAFVAGFYSLQESLPSTNFPELYANGYDSIISSIPYWATFELIMECNGTEYVFNPHSVDQHQVSNYTQQIAMSNGIVSTHLTWLDCISINIEAFAHKSILPLGVISVELESLFSNITLIIRNSLDISTSERTTLKNIGRDGDGIFIEVNPENVEYSTSAIYSSWNYKQSPVFSVSNESVTHEDTVFLRPARKINITKYVGIVSSELDVNTITLPELDYAKNLINSVKKLDFEDIISSHNQAWALQCEGIDIEIPSDELLTLAARASLYHLFANTQVSAKCLTSALGTTGLSSDSYGGMVFWDTDLWIIPAIVPFSPSTARAISNYRNFTHSQAIENAKNYGYNGAAYPWTSGRFGNCTSTGPCIDYEYHINVDIALSSWLLYMAGEDESFLRYTTWPLLRDASDFLSQYTSFNESLRKFVTKNLTDPDEYANHIDNGAFTNSGIDTLLKITILVAQHLQEKINPRWVDVQGDIYIPISDHGIVLEYSGMNGSTLIKQADVILLSFPLNYHSDPNQEIRNLFYYSLKQADIGPAMSFPVFTIVSSNLLNYGCSSQSYLKKSVIPYLRSPFVQFSEQADDNILTNGGTHPAFPFLTGHGGYLQALIYGILGLTYSARFDSEKGKFKRYLKFDPVRATTLPGGLKVSGFKYMNQLLDIKLTDDEGIIIHRGSESILVEVDNRNVLGGNYTINPREELHVPVFIPSLNILDSITECGVIANLTAGLPGEVALSAIDGNNYTYWQPNSRNKPARLLIDLGYIQSISKGFIVWGSRPAKTLSLYVYEGASVSFDELVTDIDYHSFTKILDQLEIDISEPFDPMYLREIMLLPNNETSFKLSNLSFTRYIIVEVFDVLDKDGQEGATISEIALYN